jgi:uncharacterized protein YprB with RNaseH-like and TPR domain
MLQNTFCHLNKIGPKREASFWENRILSWNDLLFALTADNGRPVKVPLCLKDELDDSFRHLAGGNVKYFSDRLKSADAWRMFADFRSGIAYIDIETTGLEDPDITTIALYDGKKIKYYVNGQNLDRFRDDILNYPLIVTFNGKTFDVPIIEKFFNIKLDQAHIDLRYVLKSLGYSGGLKRCEKQLGISRGELDGVDGYFAVLLWHEYCKTKNKKALETLLAYNIEDVVNLEKLMVTAFNEKIKPLALLCIESLPEPVPPEIPFTPDRAIIDRIKYRSPVRGFY